MRNQISTEWKDFIVNDEAVPGKNTPLYKTHKDNTPVRLLTTGCNTAIENLSKFLETVSAPLADRMKSRIKDRGHLLKLIDNINSQGLPPGTILVSFDVVNMFPNIDNERGLDTLKTFLMHALLENQQQIAWSKLYASACTVTTQSSTTTISSRLMVLQRVLPTHALTLIWL